MTRRKESDISEDEEPEKGLLIGYARVSTQQQNLDTQLFFLAEAGVEEDLIYKEKLSGRSDKRPELDKALRVIRSGDTFVVYKLDRLGRSLSDLIKRLDWFCKNGIRFKSITEGIDVDLSSCTPAQRLQVNMIASLAQFEVDLDIERTTDGVRRAIARGVKFGAKEKITDKQVLEAILMRDRGSSRAQIATHFKVAPQTIYRRMRKLEEGQAKEANKPDDTDNTGE